MKKLYFLFFTILISIWSFGQVIKADNFDYPDGSLVPNGGWANHSGTLNDMMVTSGKVLVQHGAPSEDANLAFTSVSGVVYFAFDFSVNDLGAPYAGTDNEYFAHFMSGTTTFFSRVDIVPPASSGDFSVGIASFASTADAVWATDLTYDTTYRLVVEYDQDANIAKLWINPSSSADTSITGADGTDSQYTAGAFALRQSDSSENEGILIDNLMIGQTFDDVLVFTPQTDPTIALINGPASGSTVDLGPEDLSGELEFVVTNFNVDTEGNGGDGYIEWNVVNVNTAATHDSGGPLYDLTPDPFIPLEPNKNYFFVAELIYYGSGSVAAQYNLHINTLGYNVVADITALRAHVDANGEGLYYEITGASLVTHTDGFQNRQWIQDSNIAGVLIYDPDGISSTYSVGDNVTGLKGQTEVSNGILRFIPTTDSGVIASSGNPVIPQTVSIPTFNSSPDDYESELIQVENVTFQEGDGIAVFGTGQNYTLEDGSANTLVKRTDFFLADYINTVIPNTQLASVIGVAGEFNGTAQIYVRSLNDFTLSTKNFEIPGFSMFPNPTNLGYINLLSKNNAKMNVSVFDLLGKQVLKKEISNTVLDLANLKTGLYIMKVSQDNATATTKLVIR